MQCTASEAAATESARLWTACAAGDQARSSYRSETAAIRRDETARKERPSTSFNGEMQSNPRKPSSASCRSSRSASEAGKGVSLHCRRKASTRSECWATERGRGHDDSPPQRYVRAKRKARSLSSQAPGSGLMRSRRRPEGSRTHARAAAGVIGRPARS